MYPLSTLQVYKYNYKYVIMDNIKRNFKQTFLLAMDVDFKPLIKINYEINILRLILRKFRMAV